MPLTYIKTSRESTVAVWQTTEDINTLQLGVTLSPEAAATLKTCKQHRRREIIGTRHLLNSVLAQDVTIIKDSNGRPVIKDLPDLSLSLSHSGDYSAIMLSREKRIGIDIQIHRDNIAKIAPKFLHRKEIIGAEIEALHFYWGIKESVFKAWSRGGVDFKKMIKVPRLQVIDQKVRTIVQFEHPTVSQTYLAQGKKIENFYLASVMAT